MKWNIDVHKYLSEIPRAALKIMVDLEIHKDSSADSIEKAEEKMAEEGIYKTKDSAKGRIRRALFTYFKNYTILDDDTNLTPIGKLFATDKISVEEMAFHFLANYKYSDSSHSYYPLYFILKCLQEKSRMGNEYRCITSYDFSKLVKCDSLDDINSEFILDLINNASKITEDKERREVGYDVWADLLCKSNIFYKGINSTIYPLNEDLISWIYDSYKKNPSTEEGEVITGILQYIPLCDIKSQKAAGVSIYKAEYLALQAYLFDSLDDKTILKYLYQDSNKATFAKMWEVLGIQGSRGQYKAFSGLERLVGLSLMSSLSMPHKTLGSILCSLSFKKTFIPERLPKQIIYFGTPGSGKSHKVSDKIGDTPYRTIFHPDSDYASFVGSYKPTGEGGSIGYTFIPQVFTDAYVEAWTNPTKQVNLVIEEINRGNCAQIFGDLFQLLDRDNGFSEYPVTPNKDLREHLAKVFKKSLDNFECRGYDYIKETEILQGNIMILPDNLNIYATMNTSDQSLFPMDSAFKRRWDWEYVPVCYDDTTSEGYENKASRFILKISDTYAPRWIDFLKGVNMKILKVTDSEDKQMGNYFIKSDVDAHIFVNKVMYYLWSEICKEEYGTNNNFFRDKDNSEFSFNQLFPLNDKAINLLTDFIDTMIKYGEEN